MSFTQYPQMSAEEVAREQASFITKVYGWMTFALVLTGLVAMYVADSPLMAVMQSNRMIFFGLMILQLGLVYYLSSASQSMSANTAMGIFLFYSCMNGLTFASIFMVYTASSIASTFFTTAGTFAAMSAYGYFTKRDLTSIGNLAFMALMGLIIASLVNMFLQSPMLAWITTYAGILIFVALIAYDTQKIKEMNIIGNEGTDEDKKEAIMGALRLYLDFINLFMHLLRVMGDRRN
jgi:FtsH-binding integral membrane protein